LVIAGLLSKLMLKRESYSETVVSFAKGLYRGMVTGAIEGARLGIVIGGLGLLIEMFTVTGFGQRLSYAILDLASGNIFLLLFLVAVLTIFFGMGMPTPGAYLLTVLLGAPALMKFGIPELSSHFFVFYFAIISAVTPPVAIAVLVAIGISGGNFVGTALHALRLALAGFILPIYFVLKPVMLNFGSNPIGALILNLQILIGLMAVSVAVDGYFFTRTGLFARIVCLLGAILIFFPGQVLSYVGLLFIVSFMIIALTSKIAKNKKYPAANI